MSLSLSGECCTAFFRDFSGALRKSVVAAHAVTFVCRMLTLLFSTIGSWEDKQKRKFSSMLQSYPKERFQVCHHYA